MRRVTDLRMVALLLAGATTATVPAWATESPPPPLAPSTTGPLKPNPIPIHVNVGPLGPVYISGVISGIGLTQGKPMPGDKHSRLDLSNGQLIVQTASGPVQFYVEAGGYSFPSLGAPYFAADDVVGDTFGPIPVAYVKIAPSSEFNIQAGKLLTLQGGENTFTFMNFNIERGLLWNQTNAVNRGVQLNYLHGPLTVQIYGQANRVPKDAKLGISKGASTYGAALLGKYRLTNELNLAGRVEYIKSTGTVRSGAPNLIYGPGSGAWSLTVTPSWQRGIFFVRGEASYVRAHSVVPGFGLGPESGDNSQLRGLIEAGLIF